MSIIFGEFVRYIYQYTGLFARAYEGAKKLKGFWIVAVEVFGVPLNAQAE